MPGGRSFLFSTFLHLAIVVMIVVGLPSLFTRDIPEDTPIVVQLVNVGPETHATQVTQTPPVPQEKPDAVAQAEPPKPEPPKPEPPKPEPPAPPPPPPPPPPPLPPPPPPEPKPEAPKPPPPKPEAKPKPPEPPQRKQDDVAFDQLLKNLAKRQPTPAQQQQAQATPQKQASSQPIAPLGSQLSTSELDLVKQQIEACWNVPAGARDATDLRPEFRVYMNPDGTVRSATQLNPERNSDPFFQAAADSAYRALRNPHCSPLKLPPDKYDQWQTFTITFDPKDMT